MVSFDMSNLVTKFVVKYNVMGKYLTQEEVITRLTNTFGDKLDISKVKYMTTLKLHMLLIELMSV